MEIGTPQNELDDGIDTIHRLSDGRFFIPPKLINQLLNQGILSSDGMMVIGLDPHFFDLTTGLEI